MTEFEDYQLIKGTLSQGFKYDAALTDPFFSNYISQYASFYWIKNILFYPVQWIYWIKNDYL